MPESQIRFVRFRPGEASDEEYDRVIDLLLEAALERNPAGRIPPRSSSRSNLETMEDYHFTRPFLYIVYTGDNQAIGYGSLYMRHPDAPDYEEQKHHTYLHVHLLKDWRGKGIAREVFQFLVDRCVEEGITVIEGDSYIPAGQGFAEHIGAKAGLTVVEVKVQFEDIDLALMEQWVQEGEVRNPDTEILYFRGLYSEDDAELSRFAALESAVRGDIPDGELEGFKQVMTAEKLREEMAVEASQGIISDYMLAVEADGRFSGFTRINYRASAGHKIEQRETGVLQVERGRGPGKWLKAKMILHIRDTFPDIEYLHSGSASFNAPMHGINERIGYREFRRLLLYTMRMETAQAYLESS